MQTHLTHTRPDLDRATALVEVLADYFETFDYDAYRSLPPSMHAVMASFSVVATDPGGLDWLCDRIADFASEQRREPTTAERTALFDTGVRLCPSRGLV